MVGVLSQVEEQRQGAEAGVLPAVAGRESRSLAPGAVARAAHRHEIFREVNERIAELTLHDRLWPHLFVCECSNEWCAELIEVSADEYKAVRAYDNRFMVLADHELPGIERVVGRNGRFLAIEIAGAAREVAGTGNRGGP